MFVLNLKTNFYLLFFIMFNNEEKSYHDKCQILIYSLTIEICLELEYLLQKKFKDADKNLYKSKTIK